MNNKSPDAVGNDGKLPAIRVPVLLVRDDSLAGGEGELGT